MTRDSRANLELYAARGAEVIRLPLGGSDEAIVHGLKNGD